MREKYDTPDVVAGWAALAEAGLQAAEWAMIDRHGPRGGRVVDLGCGAGRAGLALAPSGRVVIGVDRSAPMLDGAASLHARTGLPRRLVRGDFAALPVRPGSVSLALILIAGVQHIADAPGRRRALAEAARTLQPGGVLLVGVDNLAPALVCYWWWVLRSVGRFTEGGRRPPDRPAGLTDSDRALAAGRQGRSALGWHARGLLRTLRWRTGEAVIDRVRQFGLVAGTPGDSMIRQVSPTATPGRVGYHRYRHRELVADAARVGLRLVEERAGSELVDGRTLPRAVRRRDKQVLYAFSRDGTETAGGRAVRTVTEAPPPAEVTS